MKKLRKTIALFLVLAMTLSVGALAEDNEQGNEGPRLWTRWVEWDEEGHPFVVENNNWYDGGQMCHPGEHRYVVFYTAEKWDDRDQPIKPKPVKVEDLTASDGLTLTPMGDGAAKKDSLKDCYVDFTVDAFDKDYTVSYDGAEFNVSSELPDISLYSGPERTVENYMTDNTFAYTANTMDAVYYILFETDIERYGRVVESLALSKNDEDTMNDLVVFEKVSDEVYSIRLKDGAKPFEADPPRVRITIIWKDMNGETYEDDSYEIWAWNRDIIMASEEPVIDGTKMFPDWDFDQYENVADKLSNTVTMTAGEDKTVYLTVSYLDYPENQPPEWVTSVRHSIAFNSNNAALTLTADSSDGTKFTLSCDTPGEYEIKFYYWDIRFLDDDGKAMSQEETYAAMEELDELWGDLAWACVPHQDGSLYFWNLDAGEELESPYEGKVVRMDEAADFVHSLKVIVEDSTPITERYSDVAEGQWYVDAVKFVTNKGMMTGSNGKFNPSSSITGAEFVQIMYNMANRPAPAEDAAFEGVSDKDWYANAVLWAAGEGLITDTGDNALDPTAALTREQMFDILYKSVNGETAEADLSVFTDAGEISTWALDAVNWAVNNGVTDGVGNGKFAPADSTNRASVAAMLMKYYSK